MEWLLWVYLYGSVVVAFYTVFFKADEIREAPHSSEIVVVGVLLLAIFWFVYVGAILLSRLEGKK